MLFPASTILIKRVFNRRHSRADAEAIHSAFKSGHALFQDCVGGIADPGVDVAFDFEIEQRRAMLGTIEFESNRLIDRHRHGLGGGIAVIAGVNRDGLSLHASRSLSNRSTTFTSRSSQHYAPEPMPSRVPAVSPGTS